jgi:predicted phage-related endonuclease
MIDHEIRRKGLGGSDVAAVFGLDHYRDPFDVWAEKKGHAGPPLPPTLSQKIGIELQSGLLAIYGFMTGHEVQEVDETFTLAEQPWMVYSPDALCKDERRGVDAKVVLFERGHEWGEDSVPYSVELQAAWYMACLGYPAWDIIALVAGHPRIYSLTRDRELESIMLARAKEWWDRFIVGDERPPIGGGDGAARWLERTFPSHKRPDMRAATEEEILWLEDYAKVRLLQKTCEGRRDALENALKFAVGSREGLAWSGGKFTWRKTRDSKITDWQSLALGVLNQYVKEEDKRAELVEFYTRVIPGSRRIWFSAEA